MTTFNSDTNKWYKTETITKQTGKFTISTKNTYVNRDIELSYNIPGIVLPQPSSGNTNTFYITVPNGSSGTVTFTFTVDASGNTTIT